MTIYYQKVKWRLYLHRRGINQLGLAWDPETGFFYQNTSFVLEDEVKNPVSLSAWGSETGFFYENTSFVLKDEVKNPVSLSKCVQDCEYKFNNAKENTAMPFPYPKNLA